MHPLGLLDTDTIMVKLCHSWLGQAHAFSLNSRTEILWILLLKETTGDDILTGLVIAFIFWWVLKMLTSKFLSDINKIMLLVTWPLLHKIKSKHNFFFYTTKEKNTPMAMRIEYVAFCVVSSRSQYWFCGITCHGM